MSNNDLSGSLQMEPRSRKRHFALTVYRQYENPEVKVQTSANVARWKDPELWRHTGSSLELGSATY